MQCQQNTNVLDFWLEGKNILSTQPWNKRPCKNCAQLGAEGALEQSLTVEW